MAAGLGFKTFNSGDVLSAADVNGYLMQGVLVFASTAARDAAITAPAEGQFAFTKDTNSLFYYDGAAWVASGATGDIEGVTAGTGISGGGTSGTVTVTNSMATAIDAKGDLIAGTGADTFARLAVGTNGHTLVADSAEATGLKWAAPAGGGGKVLQVIQGLKTDTASSTSGSLVGTGVSATITPSSATSKILVLCSASFGCNPSNTQVTWALYRGATQIFLGDAAGSRQQSSGTTNINNSNYLQTMGMSFLDSPATTSARTYEIYYRSESGNQIYLNRALGDGDAGWVSRTASSIILLEIGA
jgi:hypothetical protein